MFTELRVMRLQPLCQNGLHLAIIFEFVDAKILRQRWKHDNRSVTIQGFIQNVLRILVTKLYST
jgi:hypothetical protein